MSPWPPQAGINLEFDRLARLIAGGPGTEIDEVDVERVIGIDRDRALGMMTLCVSIEDSVRPSRKQAQERMLQAIAQKAPECFKLAQAALATPARKPRRLGARG